MGPTDLTCSGKSERQRKMHALNHREEQKDDALAFFKQKQIILTTEKKLQACKVGILNFFKGLQLCSMGTRTRG